jgi:hypothetical protein
VYYVRTREDLLQYEDARFNSLITAVANYYIVENDQSLWGDILRVTAQELARLEYDYSYDVVNKNPIFLTPSDIKRRYAAPLYINRLYPTTDPVQYDLDYKMMLVNLIPAYFQGATVSSLEAIITAYTGLDIQVLELYKFIGQGFFDQSDRNSLSVSVNVGGNNPLDDITQLNQLQAVTTALYGAIDLGKPAHVGLEFKTVFGADEDIDAFVTSSFTNVVDEEFSVATPYTYTVVNSPFLSNLGVVYSSGPHTGTPLTLVMSGTPTLGQYKYSVTNNIATYTFSSADAGTSVSIAYSWRSNPLGITDKLRIFIRIVEGEPLNPMLWQAPDLIASTPKTGLGPAQVLGWLPNTSYMVGQMIITGSPTYFQVVTTAGTSGPNAPVFNPTFGGHTPDGATLVWTNAGTAVGVILYPTNSVHNPGTAFATFSTIIDSNGFLEVASVGGTSFPAWVQTHGYTLGQQIIDVNGYVQVVTGAGTSGSDYPAFNEIIGAHTDDGSVIWQTQSQFLWATSTGSVTLDGSVIWVNLGPPPGLVAPRLGQAWEIKSDQLSIFETS